ncbi:MAG: NAD-dependent epimerase/dehydratase family protein [Thermoleophilia bacterium]|nr:NAD-dependent epimerase/dehydratase family protein [Thermoleophilia bacterium]
MHYLVTGAAGFIGSHLAEALREDGHDVVGLDCFTDYYDVGLKEENARGFEIRRIDLARDRIDLDGVDGVFHLAGQPGVRSFGDVFEIYLDRNVLASQRLFEAAARDGVRVMFASSSSVYGDAEAYPTAEDAPPRPVSPYGITKLTCEHLARATARSFGLDVVVARYFNAYGPRQRPDMAFTRIAMCLAENRRFDLFGDGLQSRSFTYVGDVVRGTIAAMDRGSGTYNIGGGEEATMLETIAIFEELAGRPLEICSHPAVPGDQRRTKADTSLARAELGWEPTTTLRAGLAAQWEWVAARVAAR